ncbi:MAG: class II aldolase/adducin family protein [Anaerolineae bacterium]
MSERHALREEGLAESQPHGNARDEVIRVCHLLWQRGLVAATDGNVSVRLGADRLLTTPSGRSKGLLVSDDLVETDLDGVPIDSAQRRRGLRPSSEIRMHCSAYRMRPDIGAVVHAHPPIATACTVAGVSLLEAVLPEVLVNLGGIPTTRYARPSSAQGAEVIREWIVGHDALLLDHHGTLTVGRTALEAYLRLEKVEHAAQVILAARQLGAVRPLPKQEAEELLEMHRRGAYGL